jgi:hypothetical protein
MIYFWSVNWQLQAKMRGSSPQHVVSHLPNIATLRRGTHFSSTDVVWSAVNEVLSPVLPLTAWVSMFYFMESATIIIFFARLVPSGGRGGLWKKSTLRTLVIMMKKMDGPLIESHNKSFYVLQKWRHYIRTSNTRVYKIISCSTECKTSFITESNNW